MMLSLRAKLYSLVIAAIALVAVPIILLTYHKLQEISLKREQESFGNVVVLVEDNISSRYLSLLSSEISSVLRRKSQLRNIALLARGTWDDLHTQPPAERQRIMENWMPPLASFDLHFDLFDTDGTAVLGDSLLRRLVADPEARDVKGIMVKSMLRAERLPAEGLFAVITPSAGQDSREETVLTFFLPSAVDGKVVALAVALSDIVAEAGTKEEQLIHSTQEKFDTLQLYENGFISLWSGDGRLLAHKGNPLGREWSFMPAKGMEQARKTGFVDFVQDASEEQGDVDSTVFRIVYFKALDWYLVAAVPRADMEASTNAHIRRLVGLAMLSAVFGVAGMLLVTTKLIQPLRTLTRQAKALADIDLAEVARAVGRSPLPALADELPSGRRDEVGTLATAFGDMSRALDRNIRKLMDTTAVKERMQGELNAAREIQMGILPDPDTSRHRDCLIAALLKPAKEVGGDLYDYFQAPDGRQVVVVGDVADKGVPAALFMSTTVTLVRYALAQGTGPAEVMQSINDRLSSNNPGCMFVTLFLGLFDPTTGKMEYLNGGHCRPLVVDTRGQVRALEGMSGPVVGAMPGMEYTAHHTVLEPDETCLLYSDGVSEAMDPDARLFGEERIRRVLAACAGRTPEQIVDAVYEAVLAHRLDAAQSDDITMLCFTGKNEATVGKA